MNNSNNISPYDKITMLIAVIALLTSIGSIYLQFFYEKTELQITGFDINTNKESGDTLFVETNLLFGNTGDNPVAASLLHTFLGTTDRIPQTISTRNDWGQILEDDSTIYTFDVNNGQIEEVFQPNTVNFVPAKLGIDIDNIKNLDKTNDNKGEFKLGVIMDFIDSKGKYETVELIIGDIKIRLNETDSLKIMGTNAINTVNYHKVY